MVSHSSKLVSNGWPYICLQCYFIGSSEGERMSNIHRVYSVDSSSTIRLSCRII